MDELLRAIGNYGFPMVVSAYLLVRFEMKLDQVAKAISELAAAVQVLRCESGCRAYVKDNGVGEKGQAR